MFQNSVIISDLTVQSETGLVSQPHKKTFGVFHGAFEVPFDLLVGSHISEPKKPMGKTPGWTVDASRRDCLLERFCDSQTSLLA